MQLRADLCNKITNTKRTKGLYGPDSFNLCYIRSLEGNHGYIHIYIYIIREL